ncbi:MAG TPA: hypothetical protein VMV89_03495, partial [Candidatus Paceibacterota bacterium]|nr:hypothetical protein [Candidatus Paceibacterota bacterium]
VFHHWFAVNSPAAVNQQQVMKMALIIFVKSRPMNFKQTTAVMLSRTPAAKYRLSFVRNGKTVLANFPEISGIVKKIK